LRAQPARSLWITEGVTEYYAHRALRLAGKWKKAQYLEYVGQQATRAVSAARSGLTLEEAAELAWQPPDEAADDPDAYYARGHLVALALDVAIRAATDGTRSLDDVLRALLDAAEHAGGVLPLDGARLAAAVAQVAGPTVAADVAAWSQAPGEPARLDAALGAAGLKLTTDEASPRTFAGFSAESDGGSLRVVSVGARGPAAEAGLRAGDRIVRLDGVEPSPSWADELAKKSPGVAVAVEAVRATRRLLLELRLTATRPLACRLVEIPATPRAITLRNALLGR
jgi:predicted metalloprotease with PDZ domain